MRRRGERGTKRNGQRESGLALFWLPPPRRVSGPLRSFWRLAQCGAESETPPAAKWVVPAETQRVCAGRAAEKKIRAVRKVDSSRKVCTVSGFALNGCGNPM